MAAVGRKSHSLKGLLHRDSGSSKSRNASSTSLATPDAVQQPPTPQPAVAKPAPVPERPPTPPPKDTQTTPKPSHTTSYSIGGQSTASEADSSYFRPYPLSRAGSVYSLSRATFSNQLSQLTSIQLPQATTLSSSISSIPSAAAAAQALTETAAQIQTWMRKASDVLDGLDAADDAEWASAAGKEGLDEVNQAINRFESLVHVIISSVEFLQRRKDAGEVPREEMRRAVDQIENIAQNWRNIKTTLGTVRKQVELAMEWEILSDKTLAEIGAEIRSLSKFIFELEERRHLATSQPTLDSTTSLDLGDLKNIVEESPSRVVRTAALVQRFNVPGLQPLSPTQQADASAPLQEDSSLFELSARLQPLRANLDFLPMKIAVFRDRAGNIFPTACAELENDRQNLEQQWERLDADAESLRRELGEDRWVIVFKNAAKQALKMIESVTRTVQKVDESLESNTQLRHAPATLKKIESYEAKKQHYCPAIENVLGIVEKGMKDKLTVNGEIVRLHSETQKRWRSLKLAMQNLDSTLEEYSGSGAGSNNQQLRDSISSIFSSEKSALSSSVLTPGSSPASSVGISRRASHQDLQTTPSKTTSEKPRPLPQASAPGSHLTVSKRHSSLPLPSLPRTPAPGVSSYTGPSQPRKSSINSGSSSGSTTTSPRMSRYNPKIYTPPVAQRHATPTSSSANRPRWTNSTNLQGTSLGLNFKGLEAPPGYARKPPSTPGSASPRAVSGYFSSSHSATTPMRHSPLTPVSSSKAGGEKTHGSAAAAAADAATTIPAATSLNLKLNYGPRTRKSEYSLSLDGAGAGLTTPVTSPMGGAGGAAGPATMADITTTPVRPVTAMAGSTTTTTASGSRPGSQSRSLKRMSPMIPVPTSTVASGSSHRTARNYSLGSNSIRSRATSLATDDLDDE